MHANIKDYDSFPNRKIKKRGFYEKYVKRLIDILISLFAILLLLPLILVIAFGVRINLGAPVIFRQERPGLNENIFTLYKFRSMTDEIDTNGEPLPDHIRLTKFGSFLRSTSLDELPSLFNVLKGDMSLIGPRPLLVEYLPLYNDQQRRRHEVRPGLSGLAQVSGRNALDWKNRFNLDVFYVDNITLLNDIKIILLTLKKVIIREGVNFDNIKEDNKFKGTDENK